MALKLAKDSGLTDIVSSDQTNPVITQCPGTGTEAERTREVKLYLFNDNAAYRYENVTISCQDTSGTDEAGWMTFAPDNAGSPGTYASQLSLGTINDTNVGHAFWMKVIVPDGTPTQNKTDLVIKVNAVEYAN
ncbi:hypothetical protein Desku_1105 [Desulfofundulus kuznetsovii DSM 6115]|uniref:Uncharacterized protein n=1 Tax=Desulfofundulus kuznetsovii (strain DSM 6115 / VKM B-1805 / 17) TaxID=760568 RepID=A0AAU8PFY2_DESK7|nr:hypothetical protein Desku_1105 [Desulfofundulus kuznetsovii DSM 6115]